MFKKLLALLTVLSLLGCLCACSKDKTVSKTFGNGAEADYEDEGDSLDFDFEDNAEEEDDTLDFDETEEDDALDLDEAEKDDDPLDFYEDEEEDSDSDFIFDFGDTDSDCWENESFGMGFRLPDDWSFSTDEEIEQLNGFTTDQLSDSELFSSIDQDKVVYDMMASDDNLSGSNINVILQQVEGIGASNVAAVVANIAKTYKSELETQMGEMGFKMEAFDTETFEVDGRKIPGIKSEYSMAGVTMLQSQLYFKAGNDHAAIITLTAMSESDMEMLLDSLYTL